MFDIFTEWFGQGLTFPAIAVDILFFFLGGWLALQGKGRSKLIPVCLIVVILLCMVVQFLPGYFIQILAVLVCGLCTMLLAGALVTMLVIFIVQRMKKDRDTDTTEK